MESGRKLISTLNVHEVTKQGLYILPHHAQAYLSSVPEDLAQNSLTNEFPLY